MSDSAASKHAFLSYARVDAQHVNRLHRMLGAAGIAVWRDTAGLWPGEDWRARIRQEITGNTLAFIACFSQSSLSASPSYHNDEILLAIEQLRMRSPHDVWLIPVRFDECSIPEFDLGGGRTLSSLRSCDLFGEEFYEDAARLIATILRLLTAKTVASPASKTTPLPDDFREGRVGPQDDIDLSPEDKQLLLAELTRVFGEEGHALDILEQIGLPSQMKQAFVACSPAQSWVRIFTDFDNGVVVNPYWRILGAARKAYPFNRVFNPLARRYLDGSLHQLYSKGHQSTRHALSDREILEIAIGPSRKPGRYRVDVVGSPAGEASAVVRLDMDELLARTRELSAAVIASSRSDRDDSYDYSMTLARLTARETGKAMFSALLGIEGVLEKYRASVALAAVRERSLPILLRTATAELSSLSWESMYDSAIGFVCLHHSLTRFIASQSQFLPPVIPRPLRILAVTVVSIGLPDFDADKERDLLTRSLAGLVEDGLVVLDWLRAPTWEALVAGVSMHDWHVLHFIGHGSMANDRNEGAIAVTADDGRPYRVDSSQLAELLSDCSPGQRLVVLDSGMNATGSAARFVDDSARAIISHGSAAVTAMRYRVGDTAKASFNYAFYRAMSRGQSAEEATSAGRIAIAETSKRTLEWAAPALYSSYGQTYLLKQ